MKKKLKGLIALVLAIAMVVSIAPSSFGAISEEKYEECWDYYNYMYAYSSVSNTPQEIEFDPYYAERVSVGEKVHEQFSDWVLENYHTGFYETVAWEIWGRTEDGGFDSEKVKEVSYDYQVTEEDIKEFGCIVTDEEGYDTYYPPVLKTVYDSADFDIDVYDEKGNVIDTITVDMHSVGKKLDIPEGYVGYLLYTKSGVNYYNEPGEKVAFVADYEDLWTEIELMSCYDYEPAKIVPTTKMPYYIGNFYGFIQENYNYDKYVIYLSPGEDLASNEEIKKMLSDYEHYDGTPLDEKEINWSYWRVNYCGHTTSLNNDQEFENGKALTVEQYTDSRKGIYTGGYADDHYYRLNFPGVFSYDLVLKTYPIPVYDFDGSYYDDVIIDKDSLGWWEEEEWYVNKVNVWAYDEETGEGRYDNCTWYFEYDGKDYGQVEYFEDIWKIAIENGNYDYDKAKLIAGCAEHDFDYKNGKVVINPTATKKGTTEYPCKNCTVKKRVEDIECLNTIASVTLSNTSYTYTGSAFTPEVTVKGYENGTLKTLTKGVDYTVTYSNNKAVGTGKVTVTGKGNFGGTKTATFKINPAKITGAKMTVNSAYTGKAIKAKTLTVKAGSKVLKEGTDYTVIYKNNVKIGTATVTVKGKGNYTGTLTTKFTIKPGKVTGVKQTGYATKSIDLRWSAVKGATGYIIYRENSAGELVYIGSTKTNRYTVSNLKTGSKYKYAVKAYTTVNGTKIYGSTSAAKTMITKTASTKIKVSSAARERATITWNKVVGADGYEVYMATSKGGTYKKIATLSSNAERYTKQRLVSKKTYFFKVRSFKYNAGGSKVYSAYSTVKSVKVN